MISVDRDHLASPHENDVAYNHLLNRNIGNRRSLSAMGNSLSTINQGFQVTFGSGDRKILQCIAACIHHSDNDPREIFHEAQEGRTWRQRRSHYPDTTRQEVADHGNEQTDHNGRSSRGPNPIRRFSAT